MQPKKETLYFEIRWWAAGSRKHSAPPPAAATPTTVTTVPHGGKPRKHNVTVSCIHLGQYDAAHGFLMMSDI